MKIKDGYVLSEIGELNVACYIGDEVGFHGIINLNPLGVFIWNLLDETDCTIESIVEAITAKYDVDKEKATADVISFTNSLKEKNIIE